MATSQLFVRVERDILQALLDAEQDTVNQLRRAILREYKRMQLLRELAQNAIKSYPPEYQAEHEYARIEVAKRKAEAEKSRYALLTLIDIRRGLI